MNIEQKLITAVQGALLALYGQEVPTAQVQLQKTKKEFNYHVLIDNLRLFEYAKEGIIQS